jgi:peptidoglycan hydrolase CwlO-like protein
LSLFARLETALARLEQQQAAAKAAVAAVSASHAADRERLARLETAAGEALRALDTLIGQD